MSEPFLAEIRMFGFTFAPRGWALCDGQILPIAQNQSLYSLLGTTYGGDGRTSFALPDLRGRTPIHVSTQHPLGQHSGSETHTLTAREMPTHAHAALASSAAANDPMPEKHVLAQADQLYNAATNLVDMNAASLTLTGGGQAHDNMQPYQVISFCIALQGLFPSRN
ncbi:MAG: phage tail protein [Anaerolineales bacterium]|nr:phage tail protein [Anaerolineales bacterium]